MYLHRIDLHGFKSFADRTQVQFDPGITAIVGPNGCGKSNIIDAVRWVLGEQRARLLRSEKMENVIFNGTSTRRSLGMAEVALTIHNTRGVLPTEYSEVTIGRRLYRSGESEYVLNGTTCRLKDILDLFMDTGMGPGAYSVIELKMIEDILSENPQDRRRLFEEAAGITKYKLRRAQAIRRLDQTQGDLERLRDLTEEIDRQVRSLSRQARKAERHRELAEEVRSTELFLAATDHRRLVHDREVIARETASLEEQLAERTAQLQSREAETEGQRVTLIDLEKARTEAQQALNAHTTRIRETEAEARLAAERAGAATSALERLSREAALDEERLESVRHEASSLRDQLESARQGHQETEAQQSARATELQAAQQEAQDARSVLARAEAAGVEAANALRESERALETRRSRRDVLGQEHDQVESRLAEAEKRQSTTGDERRRAEEALAAAAGGRQQAAEALTEAEKRRRALDQSIEATREELADARRRYDAAGSEAELIAGLLESHEGMSEPVRALLEEPAWAASPQTAADVLDPPAHLRRAVGAALGPYADCLVVSSEAEARAGIERLRTSDGGRATFLVVERLPDRGPQVVSPTPPGTEPLAAQLASNGMVGRLSRVLLANHFLVETLEDVDSLIGAYPVARFVTPEGEWAGGGLLRGGAAERTGHYERIDRREQLEATELVRKDAATEVTRLEAALEQLRGERESLGADRLRSELDARERELSEATRTADIARTAASAAERHREELRSRLTDLLEQLQGEADDSGLQSAVENARLSVERTDAARAAATEAVANAETAARDALERHSEARVTAAAARGRFENLQRDLERATASTAAIERSRELRSQEQQDLARSRDEAARKQQELLARAEELRDALGALQERASESETAVADARSGISDADTLLRELRRLREESRDRLNEANLRITEIDTRLENLQERIWSDYEVSVAELESPPEDFDAPGARALLPDLRQQLRNIGAVNELALESYEEQRERLDFMLAQQKDLEEAEASLRSTIREINTTARKRFEETFEAVREAFQRLFEDLFGENAMADLLLDGDDPLEDDIIIRARPRGKKPSAITQLSGGEKTLTAIALLFAIYLVKPSPFCILDEVDAPLDDANIERFMRLIRSFSESTQFILVTHNKLTMEAADRLYGVTMQEQGVSRLVGVRFADVLPAAA